MKIDTETEISKIIDEKQNLFNLGELKNSSQV